jgi:hypothetical protein
MNPEHLAYSSHSADAKNSKANHSYDTSSCRQWETHQGFFQSINNVHAVNTCEISAAGNAQHGDRETDLQHHYRIAVRV